MLLQYLKFVNLLKNVISSFDCLFLILFFFDLKKTILNKNINNYSYFQTAWSIIKLVLWHWCFSSRSSTTKFSKKIFCIPKPKFHQKLKLKILIRWYDGDEHYVLRMSISWLIRDTFYLRIEFITIYFFFKYQDCCP